VPPELELSGSCTANGVATFVIKNSGGDMATASTWEIYQGSTKLAGDTFTLDAGETTEASVSGYYGKLTLKIVSGPGQGLTADTDCAAPTPTPTPTSTPVLPKLELSGSCTANGVATFVIKNSGGDMATASTWEIYQAALSSPATPSSSTPVRA